MIYSSNPQVFTGNLFAGLLTENNNLHAKDYLFYHPTYGYAAFSAKKENVDLEFLGYTPLTLREITFLGSDVRHEVIDNPNIDLVIVRLQKMSKEKEINEDQRYFLLKMIDKIIDCVSNFLRGKGLKSTATLCLELSQWLEAHKRVRPIELTQQGNSPFSTSIDLQNQQRIQYEANLTKAAFEEAERARIERERQEQQRHEQERIVRENEALRQQQHLLQQQQQLLQQQMLHDQEQQRLLQQQLLEDQQRIQQEQEQLRLQAQEQERMRLEVERIRREEEKIRLQLEKIEKEKNQFGIEKYNALIDFRNGSHSPTSVKIVFSDIRTVEERGSTLDRTTSIVGLVKFITEKDTIDWKDPKVLMFFREAVYACDKHNENLVKWIKNNKEFTPEYFSAILGAFHRRWEEKKTVSITAVTGLLNCYKQKKWHEEIKPHSDIIVNTTVALLKTASGDNNVNGFFTWMLNSPDFKLEIMKKWILALHEKESVKDKGVMNALKENVILPHLRKNQDQLDQLLNPIDQSNESMIISTYLKANNL